MISRPAARPPARPRMKMPTFTTEQKARIGAALEALLKRIREAMRPLVRVMEELAKTVSETAAALRQMTDTARAVRRDRPAWVSPYGPAPHRNRR